MKKLNKIILVLITVLSINIIGCGEKIDISSINEKFKMQVENKDYTLALDTYKEYEENSFFVENADITLKENAEKIAESITLENRKDGLDYLGFLNKMGKMGDGKVIENKLNEISKIEK
ncbi:MAG: hypothetical protein ACRC2K_10410 [Clostridium sp.]